MMTASRMALAQGRVVLVGEEGHGRRFTGTMAFLAAILHHRQDVFVKSRLRGNRGGECQADAQIPNRNDRTAIRTSNVCRFLILGDAGGRCKAGVEVALQARVRRG